MNVIFGSMEEKFVVGTRKVLVRLRELIRKIEHL